MYHKKKRSQPSRDRAQIRSGVLMIVVFTCSIFCLFFSSEAAAGISVNPTVIEESVAHGERVVGQYTVINTGKEKMYVEVQPVDWLQRYLKKDDTAPVEAWLHFETTTFEIEPSERKEVPFYLELSDEVTSEQVAQVFFAFSNQPIGEASLTTRLGVILYCGVSGEGKMKLKIKDFDVHANKNPRGLYDLNTTVRIENKGTVHTRPRGAVYIEKFGKELATIQIEPRKGIYAGTTDTVTGIAKNVDLKKGRYKAVLKLDCSMYEFEETLKDTEKFTVL